MCTMWMSGVHRGQKSITSLGARAVWILEVEPRSFAKQQVFLNIELSLQSLILWFKIMYGVVLFKKYTFACWTHCQSVFIFTDMYHHAQFNEFTFYFLFCVYGCFACMCLCTMCMQYPQRPEEDIRSHGTEVKDNCQLPCGCWELNPGPLQEQPVLLTTEPSLQPPAFMF